MNKEEEIKNNLLRQAALAWGYQSSQMDVEAFDPLVKLMAGALATELALVYKEMHASEDRIMARILELLTPDIEVNAQPAHAIVNARAIEPLYKTRESDQLFFPLQDEQGTREVFFSPVGAFPIVNGFVQYLVTHQHVIQVDGIPHRDIVMAVQSPGKIGVSTVWMGLSLDANLSQLEGLRFFFNWRNELALNTYLSALASSTWSLNGKPLAIKTGLDETSISGTEQSHFREAYSATAKLKRKIFDHYQQHFFVVEGFVDPSDNTEELDLLALKANYPKTFEEAFNMEDLAQLTTPLLWIRVDLPGFVSPRALSEMEVQINAFPIINRRYRSKDFVLRDHMNIIPLETEHYFFDIDSVRNQANERYQSTPLDQGEEYRAGSYTLRREAVGKYRQRDAISLLNRLLDLLRDDTDAFSALNTNYLRLRDTLETIKQNLNLLEKHVGQQVGDHEFIPYLFVTPKQEGDRISIGFWETNGATGNGIPSGSKLDIYKFSGLQRNHIYFLTATGEGRNRLGKNQQKLYYQNALLSRGRVVTTEDIRTFCLAKLGTPEVTIDIKRGYYISSKAKEGLLPNLSVDIAVPEQELEAKSMLAPQIETELNAVSSYVLPIHINVRAL